MVFGGFILIMALIGLCGALGNSPCVLKDSIEYPKKKLENICSELKIFLKISLKIALRLIQSF